MNNRQEVLIDLLMEAATTHDAYLLFRSRHYHLVYSEAKSCGGPLELLDEDLLKMCLGMGITIIDARSLTPKAEEILYEELPLVAVGCKPDNPPYGKFDKAPLPYVLNIYEACGAKIYNGSNKSNKISTIGNIVEAAEHLKPSSPTEIIKNEPALEEEIKAEIDRVFGPKPKQLEYKSAEVINLEPIKDVPIKGENEPIDVKYEEVKEEEENELKETTEYLMEGTLKDIHKAFGVSKEEMPFDFAQGRKYLKDQPWGINWSSDIEDKNK